MQLRLATTSQRLLRALPRSFSSSSKAEVSGCEDGRKEMNSDESIEDNIRCILILYIIVYIIYTLCIIPLYNIYIRI